MQNNLISIGFILILIGFLIVFIGSCVKSSDSKFAVVGLLGPFPFGFGNDKRLFVVTLIISIAVMVVWFILSRA